jgi:hypothetical protein
MLTEAQRRQVIKRRKLGTFLIAIGILIVVGGFLKTCFTPRLYKSKILYAASTHDPSRNASSPPLSILEADRERLENAVQIAFNSLPDSKDNYPADFNMPLETMLKRMRHQHLPGATPHWVAVIEFSIHEQAASLHNNAFRQLLNEDGKTITVGNTRYTVKNWALPNGTPSHPPVRLWLGYAISLASLFLIPGAVLYIMARDRLNPKLPRPPQPHRPIRDPDDPW